MKTRYLFIIGLLFAICTGAFAQKKVVAIWLAEDEDGILNKGRKMQMSTKLRQEINETLYGFQAVMRQETLKEKELAYTQAGNTREEGRAGNELLADYYLSPHVYAVGDGVAYIVVDILTPREEVIVTGDQDDVPLYNITEAFSNLALEVLNRLIEKMGTEAIVENYVRFPNLGLEVQTVDAGTCDWETARQLCEEMELSGRGWRLPTEAEMTQILRQPEAATKLHINTGDSFWTSTDGDGDRQKTKKTVKANALQESGSVVNVKSSSSYKDDINKIRRYNPVSTSSYMSSPYYKVRAVRKY
ncbi:MAG: DUF1566 domain-containing protein [Bacteroides sp.]|nr:DUF1566 domain-containing protein [Bacteroides sp.]